MKQTTNLKLNKPERTDPADITQLNENWDIIDEEITTHEQRQDNPHNVTKEQLGIDLTNFEEHIANKDNPHEVTAEQVNAVSKNGDTVNGDLTVKGAFTVEDNPIKATNGVTTVEIQGLNNPTPNGHHFMDFALSGTNGSVHLRVNLENANGMHSPRELMQILTLANSGEEHWYQIFHEGNKPTGSYLGNGSSTKRTIDTGGIGNVLFIWTTTSVTENAITKTEGIKVYVLPTGAVAYGADNGRDRGVDSNEMKYENGVLTIANNRDWFNRSGTTYYYQCL